MFIFGYGRRICPSWYGADNALFIIIVQTLAVFDITKIVKDGKIVEPKVKLSLELSVIRCLIDVR